MLRRAIAAVLVLTLAILVLPCGAAAPSQQGAHGCCAASLMPASADCCHSAAPHPAATPATDRDTQAVSENAATALPQFAAVPIANFPYLSRIQPSKRIPSTILRT
jgi:hypothetical protein